LFVIEGWSVLVEVVCNGKFVFAVGASPEELDSADFKEELADMLDDYIERHDAGPYQGLLDNGRAVMDAMTPEQLAAFRSALKSGGAS
jgi:hypothetical protein